VSSKRNLISVMIEELDMLAKSFTRITSCLNLLLESQVSQLTSILYKVFGEELNNDHEIRLLFCIH